MTLPTDVTFWALVSVFLSVALLAGSVASLLMNDGDGGRRRLQEVVSGPKVAPVPDFVPLNSSESESGWESIENLLPRSKKELSRLRLRMARSGVRAPYAPMLFSLAELVLPVVLGGALYASHITAPPLLWLLVGATGLLGFVLPGLWLEQQSKNRRQAIENGLPDALDLMVVCIEAGAGLDQAIVKTSDEISFTYPELGEELRLLNAEIRGGKARLDAFKSLAQRTKSDEVRSLTAILIQTDKFGTSIGQALRTHSDTSREKRRQRAEETAEKIGVKLVFPLVLFFFPALYAVILGPAVIQFVRQFMG